MSMPMPGSNETFELHLHPPSHPELEDRAWSCHGIRSYRDRRLSRRCCLFR